MITQSSSSIMTQSCFMCVALTESINLNIQLNYELVGKGSEITAVNDSLTERKTINRVYKQIESEGLCIDETNSISAVFGNVAPFTGDWNQ